MRRALSCILLIAGIGLMPAANAQSYAPAAGVDVSSPMGKPLVLLRFNQRSVYYEKQLFMAISRAVEAKPGVLFDVVSMVPVQTNPQTAAQWQSVAYNHAQQVMQSMHGMGVPRSRIQFRVQPKQGLNYDEVHIFVR